MNLLDLGGLLKQERERRGLSVRDVMDATKISRRNLNALEAGEVKLLPHPVYLKGYVRNYARLVGLDPEPLAAVVDQQSDGDSGYIPQIPSPPAVPAPAEVLEVLAQQPEAEPSQPEATQSMPSASESAAAPAVTNEPVKPAAVAPIQPEPAAEQPESVESQIRFPRHTDLTPKPRKRLWPWVVLLVLVCGTGGLVYQCQRIQADNPPPPVAAPVVIPMDNATNATEANATAAELESNATLTEPAPSLPSAPVPSVPASVPSAMPEMKPVAPGASAAPVAAGSVASAPIEVSRKPQAPVQAPAQGSGIETRTVGMQELLVVGKPGEVCWVEVSEGQRRKTFTLRDGDSRRFEFSNKAKVRLGNAGGVTFQLNGSFYPYDGQRGQTAVVEIGAR